MVTPINVHPFYDNKYTISASMNSPKDIHPNGQKLYRLSSIKLELEESNSDKPLLQYIYVSYREHNMLDGHLPYILL